MSVSTYNVRCAFNMAELDEIAQRLREDFYLFGTVVRIRGVGKAWLKTFCTKYNLIDLFTQWERKNRAPYQWVFATNPGNEKLRVDTIAQIREINAQIRTLQARKRALRGEFKRALGR